MPYFTSTVKKALIMTVLQYSEKETGNANNQLTRADQQDDKVVFFFARGRKTKTRVGKTTAPTPLHAQASQPVDDGG
jgi:hypothetical protein